MNPDKLFDYLDGKLSPADRAQLEEKLMSDELLRRQFNVAREIHRGGGEKREVIVPSDPERGGLLGRRIAVAAIVLVFVNVAAGLAFITLNGRKSLSPSTREAEVRRQVTASISAAAEKAMPLPTFLPAEIQLTAPRAEWESVMQRVILAAGALGGDAQKGLPDEKTLTIVADIPSEREDEFRQAVTTGIAITSRPEVAHETATTPVPNKRTIVQVRIADAAK